MMMAVQKMVMCSDGLIAALIGRESLTKVAVCSLESFTWSFSAHDKWRRYEDLAFSGGRLYGLTSGEDLIAFDVRVDATTGEAMISRIERVISGFCDRPHYHLHLNIVEVHYLVPSRASGLVMVRRLFSPACKGGEAQHFDVFPAGLTSSSPPDLVEHKSIIVFLSLLRFFHVEHGRSVSYQFSCTS
ncbi:hypothetical protein PR202_ga31405 [Eleusine coracana subsp. coracana]|uniref:KIB1-4 beta-propeller domain-containing protein n=1 Tax=Eleusine coracana subsp. coracana TaxID=191504 RepID=A0AAV5DSE6_ELECO|nr:hypothetical protein PR202_ga31405 [Eleusine coracana subsp. coracana]